MKHSIILLVFALVGVNATAQNTEKSSFFLRLLFPFDYGVVNLSGNTLETGTYLKTGFEYRFKPKALFIRFNYDSRSYGYEVPANQTTNVIKGRLSFSDFTLGPGYRVRAGKIGMFGLTQAGLSAYRFPLVTPQQNNFAVEDMTGRSLTVKTTFGFEYYVDTLAAITLELCHVHNSEKVVFWEEKPLNHFGISVGLTTTLF